MSAPVNSLLLSGYKNLIKHFNPSQALTPQKPNIVLQNLPKISLPNEQGTCESPQVFPNSNPRKRSASLSPQYPAARECRKLHRRDTRAPFSAEKWKVAEGAKVDGAQRWWWWSGVEWRACAETFPLRVRSAGLRVVEGRRRRRAFGAPRSERNLPFSLLPQLSFLHLFPFPFPRSFSRPRPITRPRARLTKGAKTGASTWTRLRSLRDDAERNRYRSHFRHVRGQLPRSRHFNGR